MSSIGFEHIDVLLKLFFAHLISDFVLQPDKWVKSKNNNKFKSGYIYLHCAVHSVFAYLFAAKWDLISIPILIFIFHYLIDLAKCYLGNDSKWFLLDQILHVLVIIILWGIVFDQFENLLEYFSFYFDSNITWLILVAYLFLIWPVSIIINQLTKNWQLELGEGITSLKNAGKWIGIIERILVLTFVIYEQFEAIGFLIAAKSVFRFGDLQNSRDRKLTEYVLIGTFLSFGITIGVGLLVQNFISK